MNRDDAIWFALRRRKWQSVGTVAKTLTERLDQPCHPYMVYPLLRRYTAMNLLEVERHTRLDGITLVDRYRLSPGGIYYRAKIVEKYCR